jgi:hypothetical protein
VPDPQKFAHHEKGKLRSKFILLEATFHIPFKKFEIRLQQVDLPEGYTKKNKKEASGWKSPYLPTIAAFLVRFVCHATRQAQQ